MRCKFFYRNAVDNLSIGMRIKKLLCAALVALAVLMIFANQVYAQTSPSTAKITKLDKPTAIAVGKSLTISVTASYKLQSQFEWLFVAIQDSISEEEPSKPFPTMANSCPPIDRPWNQSICLYHGSSGDFTVSFTLTAPYRPARWDLYAVAAVVAMDQKSRQPIQLEKGDVRGFQVAVTLPQIESVTSSIMISTTSIHTTITDQISQPTMLSRTTMVSQPTSNLAQSGLIAAIIGAIALGSILAYSKRDNLRDLRE